MSGLMLAWVATFPGLKMGLLTPTWRRIFLPVLLSVVCYGIPVIELVPGETFTVTEYPVRIRTPGFPRAISNGTVELRFVLIVSL